MSFKDVRDLAEHLKLLGYPKTFPLQALYSSYGSLNSFKVVADILQWLAGRLEPGSILPGGIESESDRILLIRSATEFFVTKSGIKLNPRKLYASSSSTAKELQKITSHLMSTPVEVSNDEEENFKSINQIDLGDKMEELRRVRELSSELTNRGATLYDLLSKELVNKDTRMSQSTRPLELSAVEKTLKNAISATQFKAQAAKSQLEALRVEKNALNAKLQRKKGELDRSKQRLEALTKIRPAYIEEYEILENELRDLFIQYFVRIQCRDGLRMQMTARTKNPTPAGSPLVKTSTTESPLNFLPEGLIDDDDDEIGNDDDDDDLDDLDDDDDELLDANDLVNKEAMKAENHNGSRRLGRTLKRENIITEEMGKKDLEANSSTNIQQRTSGSRVRPTTGRLKPRTGTTLGRHKVIGSMLGDNEDELLDSTLGSDNSDSEIDLVGGEYDLNTDDDLSLSKITGEVPKKSLNKFEHHSDEDF